MELAEGANPLGFLVILESSPRGYFSSPILQVRKAGPREWVMEGAQVQPGLLGPEQMLPQGTALLPWKPKGMRLFEAFLWACTVQPHYLIHLVKSLSYWRYFARTINV